MRGLLCGLLRLVRTLPTAFLFLPNRHLHSILAALGGTISRLPTAFPKVIVERPRPFMCPLRLADERTLHHHRMGIAADQRGRGMMPQPYARCRCPQTLRKQWRQFACCSNGSWGSSNA